MTEHADKTLLIERIQEIAYKLSSHVDVGAGVHHRNPAYPDMLPALIRQVEIVGADLTRWLRDARQVVEP